MASALAVRDRAGRLLCDGVLYGDAFDQKIGALIRHVGCEDRPLDTLTDDELDDVDIALDRVEAGRLVPFRRVDGTFEMRLTARPEMKTGRRR